MIAYFGFSLKLVVLFVKTLDSPEMVQLLVHRL